ncbi:MAG: hypothetical protein K9L68_08600, partial [Spirochaetales bacterium]|nr:hypothetical protein [Spirochaetales bacterium]MCF7938644.1 hypothetical protein [Spirochaetales bacterium]
KEDGALDSSGRPVLIDSVLPQNGRPGLNCSGLVKWIVDGILRGRDQDPVSIQDAKKKITSARGNRWTRAHESAEDPFFGLDWTRNLALEAISPETDRASLDQVDVSSVRGIEYLEDRGFPLQDLPYVLFQLVRNEPGYFYLASINRRLDIAEGRELIKHHHTLAIFPFISEEESPSVEAWVFERIGDEIRALRYRDNQLIKRADSERNGSGSAVETEVVPPSADIYQRYAGEQGTAYVHLVRIRASGDFLPHELDLEGNEPL